MAAKLRERVFYDEPLNTGRQHEFDLARAVVIFFLALIHVTIECSTDEMLTSGIPYLFDTVIGGPFSAPMYMFVMGVGMFYTKKSRPKDHFKRGLKLLILGYILNICRFLIPYSIGYAITGDFETYIEPLLTKMLGNDVLVFAGIAMMLMAGLIALKTPRWALLSIAVVFSGLGTVLNGIDVGNDVGNIFLGYLIGTENAACTIHSYFPLLNWFIFPVAGYLFASILVKVKDKKTFYLLFSPACLVITIVYFICGIVYTLGMFGEGQYCFYHMTIVDAFFSMTLTLGLIGLYYFISLVMSRKALSVMGDVSRNITYVYFIHWIFVSFIVNVVINICTGSTILSSVQIVVLGSWISMVSIVLSHYLRKFVINKKSSGGTSEMIGRALQ